MIDCLFCKIIAGAIPSGKVDETDVLYAFDDVNPIAPTHVLIVPKKHICSSLELNDQDNNLAGQIFILANKIARQRGIDKTGFRIVTNTGSDGGQTVAHLHFHLLGGRAFGWPPG